MTLPEFLTNQPDGEVVLTNHRIGLYDLVHHYGEGWSPEMLAVQYPTLSLALIHKVIAFYLENRQEVDAFVGDCRQELDQQMSLNPRRIDVATLRQGLEAMRRPESA